MIHNIMLGVAAVACAMMSAAALHWTLMALPNLDRKERYGIAFSFFFIAALLYFALLNKIIVRGHL